MLGFCGTHFMISSPLTRPARCFSVGRCFENAGLRSGYVALLLGVLALLPRPVSAQTVNNWTGASSSLWGTAGNWSGGVPTNLSIATFNTSAGLPAALTLTATSTAYSLNFSNAGGAKAYTLDAAGNVNVDTLTLTAGITNSDAGALTFYNQTTLGANQTWSNNGGTMNFYGNVNLGSGATGRTLTLNGSGLVNINGVIADGATTAGSLTYAGTGTLNLIGANTYTGATNINSGTVTIQNAGALGTASNTANTTVANGAVLQIQGNITTTNAGTLILNGTGAGAGALQNISANNTWNSAISLGSNATISNSTAGNVFYLGNSGGGSLFTLGSNTLTIDGAGDTFINSSLGVAGDTGGLIKNGTGDLTLWGYNSFYTGATVVNAGSLELVVGPMTSGWYGINGALTIGTGSLADTATVNIWSASHALGASYANQISPSSAITLNAGGSLNVGVSTTAGSFTMNGGAVNITAGQTVTLSNGVTSNTNTAHQTSQILGGTLALVSPTTTFNVAQDTSLASDLTISSAITGAAITKTGNGSLTLSGANGYTGGTTLSAGTIYANNATALGTGAVTINGGTLGSTAGSTIANNLTLQGNAGLSGITSSGILTQSGGSQTLILANTLQSGAVKLSANNTGYTLTAQVDSGTSTIQGAISNGGTGAGGLTKTGNGTLVISGANSYTGATTVNGGTLQLGANNTLNAGTSLALNNSTLNLNGFSTSIGNLSFNNGTINFGSGSPTNTLVFANLTSGTGLLTINNWTSGSTTLAATTAGIASTLLNQIYFAGSGSGAVEAGSLAATGNGQPNGYFITPNNAFLTWNGGGADNNWTTTGNWVGGIAPSSTVGSTQKLDFTGSTRLAPAMNGNYYVNALKFDSAAGAFTVGQGGNTLTLNGALPSIIQQSASNQTISGGTILLSVNSVIDVTGTGILTLSSALSGSGSLSKLSAGTLALSGNNSAFSGGISVNAGTLQVSGSNNVLGTAGTTVLSGATLQLNSGLTLANALSLTGTGASGNGALFATPGAGNTATLNGLITLGGATTINLGSGTLVVNGGVTGAGNSLTLTGAGNSTFGSAITTGSGGVTLNGSGTTTFSGANTYTGLTTVNSGFLNLSGTAVKGGLTLGGGTVNDNASNQLATSGALTINSGTFNLGGFSETVANLSGTGGTLALGSGTLTLGSAGSTTYAGAITGTGTLASTNTGKLTLTGASAGFTGHINLSNGVIVAGATNATGTATVAVSGTGNFEVQGGSTLGSNFTLSTNGAATNNGAIENVSGNNTLSGNVSVTANSRLQSDAGTLTLSGPVAVSAGTTLNVGGTGNTTLNGAITGGATTAITKDGSGTLALGAANSGFTGTVTVGVGTLQANAANVLSNAASLTINSGGTFLANAANALATSGSVTNQAGGTLNLNGTANTLTGLFNNAGTLAFGSGGALTLNGSNATLSGTITGSGTLTIGAGQTLTLGANFNAANLNIVLAGGTFNLNGSSDTFGSLTITGNSILDFGNSSASILNVSGVSITAGMILSVTNWNDTVDYFYDQSNPGGQGAPPLNQIVFTGYTGGDTHWVPYDHQITPAPEPAVYGAALVGFSTLLIGWRRRRAAAVR